VNKKDIALAAATFAYVVFLGPFLISARDWFAVVLGFGLLGVLVGLIIKRFIIDKEKAK
jgi:multisubunit Na+/H+ antiporter MnhC subunit